MTYRESMKVIVDNDMKSDYRPCKIIELHEKLVSLYAATNDLGEKLAYINAMNLLKEACEWHER